MSIQVGGVPTADLQQDDTVAIPDNLMGGGVYIEAPFDFDDDY